MEGQRVLGGWAEENLELLCPKTWTVLVTPRYFCTYFDHNYLPRGMVMLESLHANCPEAHIYVLCLSDTCYDGLAFLDYPFVTPIRLQDFEKNDVELHASRSNRSLVEYYFTITPCLPWYLLNKRNLEEVTYLDADMIFFSSPEPIFDEAQDASVIITPHRFPDVLKDREVYGKYNVSWLTFRNSAEGLDCLRWYREGCLEWCYDRLEENRFADQKYLDYFPEKFTGVHIIAHPGAGVAPWNVDESSIGIKKKSVTINKLPLIFYHAHGVKRIKGPFFISGLSHYQTSTGKKTRKAIFTPYLKMLTESERKVRAILPFSQGPGLRKEHEAAAPWKRIYCGIKDRSLIVFPG